jgi:hypothetical protein
VTQFAAAGASISVVDRNESESGTACESARIWASVGIEPAEVAHDPLAVLVEIRHAVLPRDVESLVDLGVIVDQE